MCSTCTTSVLPQGSHGLTCQPGQPRTMTGQRFHWKPGKGNISEYPFYVPIPFHMYPSLALPLFWCCVRIDLQHLFNRIVFQQVLSYIVRLGKSTSVCAAQNHHTAKRFGRQT